MCVFGVFACVCVCSKGESKVRLIATTDVCLAVSLTHRHTHIHTHTPSGVEGKKKLSSRFQHFLVDMWQMYKTFQHIWSFTFLLIQLLIAVTHLKYPETRLHMEYWHTIYSYYFLSLIFYTFSLLCVTSKMHSNFGLWKKLDPKSPELCFYFWIQTNWIIMVTGMSIMPYKHIKKHLQCIHCCVPLMILKC